MSKLKLLFVAMLALGALAVASGSSTAASFRISPGGVIRATSLGKLTFEAGINIECNITMNGELETALLPKTVGTAFGEISEVRWANCVGGEVERVFAPFSLTYQGILGTLPNNVTGLQLAVERADFRLNPFGPFIRCRYRGDAQALMRVTGTNPYTSELIRSLENSLGLVEGSGCPATGKMRGTFSLSPTQTITRL